MNVPATLVYLGVALDLSLEVDGHRTTIAWKKKHWLCSDAAGRTLYVVPASTRQRRARRTDERERAAKVYERFSQHESERVDELEVKLGPPTKRGRAATIAYRSDKWTGKSVDYEHAFDAPPRVVQAGNVYRLAGPSLRVTAAGITG
jgi:hypothetical protein